MVTSRWLPSCGPRFGLSGRGRAAYGNAELIRLYWTVGHAVLQQQAERGWAAKMIDRLAADLTAEFPDMHGWSRANLYLMRSMAAAWPDWSIVSTELRQLPWNHIRVLLHKVPTLELRNWYAEQDAHQGWTLKVLERHVATSLHNRLAATPSSFTQHLHPADADQAQQLTRDPYVFGFLSQRDQLLERIGHLLAALAANPSRPLPDLATRPSRRAPRLPPRTGAAGQ